MNLKKQIVKFFVDHLASNALISAGTQIGEAIGKKIGVKIYKEPPAPVPPKGEDAK